MAIAEGFEPSLSGPWPDGLSVSLYDLVASAETRTQIYGNGPYAGRRRQKHFGGQREDRTPRDLSRRFYRPARCLLRNICPYWYSHSELNADPRFRRPLHSPLCYRSELVSEAGLEPAKPASLAQYLCQFGYSDRWSPERVSNPQTPLFKSGSYTSSDTGRIGVPTRIRTGSPAGLSRLRMPVSP